MPSSKGKLEKVGEETVLINLNVLKDYSEHSSYRHIIFKQDEYFSSLLFYIDVVHTGMNVRLNDSIRIDQLSKMEGAMGDEKANKVKN